MNEKPLRSESIVRSEEWLKHLPPDSLLQGISEVPCSNETGLVLEEFEDRIEYVYKVRYFRYWEGGPEDERHVLHSESKEEARNKTSEQIIGDMVKCFEPGNKIQRQANKMQAAHFKANRYFNEARRTLEVLDRKYSS